MQMIDLAVPAMPLRKAAVLLDRLDSALGIGGKVELQR